MQFVGQQQERMDWSQKRTNICKKSNGFSKFYGKVNVMSFLIFRLILKKLYSILIFSFEKGPQINFSRCNQCRKTYNIAPFLCQPNNYFILQPALVITFWYKKPLKLTMFQKSQKSFSSMATILEFLLKYTVWSSNYGGYLKLLKVI